MRTGMFKQSKEMKEACDEAMKKLQAMSGEELLALGEKHKNGQVALFLKAMQEDAEMLDTEE